jgi:hypothetical protein
MRTSKAERIELFEEDGISRQGNIVRSLIKDFEEVLALLKARTHEVIDSYPKCCPQWEDCQRNRRFIGDQWESINVRS